MKKRDYLFDKQMIEILKEEKRQSEERKKELNKIFPKAIKVITSINGNYFENKPLFNGIENEIHEVADLCKKSVYFNDIVDCDKLENKSAKNVYFNYVTIGNHLSLLGAIDTIKTVVRISILIKEGKYG